MLAGVGTRVTQQNQHSRHQIDKPQAAMQDNPSTPLQQRSHHYQFICVRITSDPLTHSKQEQEILFLCDCRWVPFLPHPTPYEFSWRQFSFVKLSRKKDWQAIIC